MNNRTRILAAGLTPAWQQIMVLDRYQPGEVNRAAETHWCASGKAVNVAVAAQHLGAEVMSLSLVGGWTYDAFESDLQSLGVPHHMIRSRSTTRVCTTLIDRSEHTISELVENGRPVEDDELDRFAEAFADEAAQCSITVLSGSLPNDVSHNYYRRLLESINPAKTETVCDFRGEGLLNILSLCPTLIKPNRQEMAKTFGRSLAADDDLLDAMRELNRQGARWVLVTDGERPAYLSSTEHMYRITPSVLDGAEIVNPIGCGDSMTAGIAVAVAEGREMIDAVRLGIAAATDNLRGLMPCRLDSERVRREVGRVTIDRI